MVPKSFLQASDKFDDFTKTVINILPDGNSDNLKSGSIVRFTLPPGSTFSLSNLALHLNVAIPRFAQQIGTGTTSAPTVLPTVPTRSYTIYPPKYIASLIQAITIYGNGSILQQITDYNVIVSILSDFSKTNSKGRILSNAAGVNVANLNYDNTTANNQSDYTITDFFGLLGSAETKESSGNLIDTNMLGNVVLEIQFARPNVLARSNLNSSIPVAGALGHLDGAAISNSLANVDFVISNLKLSVERLSLDSAVYDSMATVMKSGGSDIMFNHYQIFKGNGNVSAGNMRISVNSQSIKYCMGYFEDSTKSSPLPMVLDLTTRNSSFFSRLGNSFTNSIWTVGSTNIPVNPMSLSETFTNTLRLMGDKSSTDNKYCDALDSLEKWRSSFMVSPLSLEYSNDFKSTSKLDSGLSTENLPLNITFTYNLSSSPADIPCILVVTNRTLKIRDNVNLSIDI